MKEFFAARKAAVSRFLEDFITRREPELARINSLGPAGARRLLDYSRQGKMIRGGLAGLGQGLLAGGCNAEADRLGAVMELFQSALLIHDDIMDRDPLRRGKPAMHMQYARELEQAGAADPGRTGESLGICLGDIAFFLGYEILAVIDADAQTLRKLIALCSREMTGVGLGQMQDIRAGVMPQAPSREEILSLYVHKTGRYTFSLPLMAGALLGGADDDSLAVLSELGEVLGVIFQIKDDELGLFGTRESIGKPVGTDLSEGKQTLFYNRLTELLPAKERSRLRALVGAEIIPEEEVLFVRDKLKETGVLDEIHDLTRSYQEKALSLMDRLPNMDSEHGRVLSDFVVYNLNRTI